jgi:hypothetical protein
MSYTKQDVKNILDELYGIDSDHANETKRSQWFIDVSKKRLTPMNKENQRHSLIGAIGDATEVEWLSDSEIKITDRDYRGFKPGIGHVYLTTIHEVKKVGETFHHLTFSGHQRDLILKNLDGLREDLNFKKLIEEFGEEGAINEASTIRREYEYNPPTDQLPEVDFIHVQESKNEISLEVIVNLNGQRIYATDPDSIIKRVFWNIVPDKDHNGSTNIFHRRRAGLFTSGSKISVSTSLKNRKAFVLLNAEDCEIKCTVHIERDNGDVTSVEKTYKTSLNLPEYRYF